MFLKTLVVIYTKDTWRLSISYPLERNFRTKLCRHFDLRRLQKVSALRAPQGLPPRNEKGLPGLLRDQKSASATGVARPLAQREGPIRVPPSDLEVERYREIVLCENRNEL